MMTVVHILRVLIGCFLSLFCAFARLIVVTNLFFGLIMLLLLFRITLIIILINHVYV